MGFFRDQVLPRLTVEDVFTSRAKIRKHGREWRGACPIHGGRGDNLSVSDRTLAWYCHSQCQVGGGPIEFIAACEGGADAIPVKPERAREIIRELAALVGVREHDNVRETFVRRIEEEEAPRPPRAEVFALWRAGVRATGWPASAVESWGVDPASVADELRGLSAPSRFRWSRTVGRQWGDGCYELIIPLRDPQMRPVSYVARSASAVRGIPKSGSPTGVSGRGLVMANAAARDIIRDQMPVASSWFVRVSATGFLSRSAKHASASAPAAGQTSSPTRCPSIRTWSWRPMTTQRGTSTRARSFAHSSGVKTSRWSGT